MDVDHGKEPNPGSTKITAKPVQLHQSSWNKKLNRLLKDTVPAKDTASRIMQYYHLCLSLESLKNAASGGKNGNYNMALMPDDSTISFYIDLKENPDFCMDFQQNFHPRNMGLKKNLDIGIFMKVGTSIKRLLHATCLHTDFVDFDFKELVFCVPLRTFAFDESYQDELGLSQSEVERLNEMLVQPDISLEQVIATVKGMTGLEISIEPYLNLVLTVDNPSTVHARRELKNLIDESYGQLLEGFLHNTLSLDFKETVFPEELISVVPMDETQRLAIADALSKRLSVVTGPPGSGKTQMILNLMANAMVRGLSVVVASKNNKAVDNVFERFKTLTASDYLLRFGNNTIMGNLPATFTQLLNKLPSIHLDEAGFEQQVKLYKQRVSRIRKYRKAMEKYMLLKAKKEEAEKTIIDCQMKTDRLMSDLQAWKQNYYKEYGIERPELLPVGIDWNSYITTWDNHTRKLQTNTGFLGSILFRLFRRKGILKILSTDYIRLPEGCPYLTEIDTRQFDEHTTASVGELEVTCIRIGKALRRMNDLAVNLKEKEQVYRLQLDSIEKELRLTERMAERLLEQLGELQPLYEEASANLCRAVEEMGEITYGRELLMYHINHELAGKDTPGIIAGFSAAFDPTTKGNIRGSEFERRRSDILNVFRLTTATSLSVPQVYPLKKDSVDLVIVDEASQCDVASAIPLVFWAKSMTVIGDPMQLRHITSVTRDETIHISDYLDITGQPNLDYVQSSLWDYCRNLLIKAGADQPVGLKRHYRCHPDIIRYSAEVFYKDRLGMELEVMTGERPVQLDREGLFWIPVKGTQDSERNVNTAEALQCAALARQLLTEYPECEIAILTPFKDQATAIELAVKDTCCDGRVGVATVHTFQGDEKDIILFSPMVTDNSPVNKLRWLDYTVPYLVNVAVTRGRKAVYVVGNAEYIRRNSSGKEPLGALVNYCEPMNL